VKLNNKQDGHHIVPTRYGRDAIIRDKIKLGRDGLPIIPDVSGKVKQKVLDTLLREFLNKHYGI
jgi:hypothetical protein